MSLSQRAREALKVAMSVLSPTETDVHGDVVARGLEAVDRAGRLVTGRAAAELAEYRALELGDVDGRVSASCSQPHHPTWLRAVDDTRGCPWCEIDGAHEETIGANLARWEEERDNARLRLALASAQRGRREAREVARNAVRVTEQSMKELKREHAANTSYSAALPWARLMDDEDLAEFLAEVEHAIAIPGATPAEALAAVEKACGTWRLIAEAQHAHNTAPGPDAMTRLLAPTQALREDEDPFHPCGCPKRFARHADGCPTYSPATGCGDGPDQWCGGCSACQCEPHAKGCVKASAPQ